MNTRHLKKILIPAVSAWSLIVAVPVWAQAPDPAIAPAEEAEKKPMTEVEKQIFGDPETQVRGSTQAAPVDPAADATTPFARVSRENEENEKKKPARPRRFITLTMGVEHDEKLPPVPKSISFKGDFRRVTAASFAKEINSIRFKPTREGVGTLTVHDARGLAVAEYRIEVRKSRLDTIMREMQGLLGDIEGLQIKVVNNKVIIDGQILLPRDMNRIYNVVSQYGDQATSMVSISPMAQKKIAEFIARDINNPEIEVRAVNDKFILQGTANSEDEAKRAEVIAKLYVPPIFVEKAEAENIVRRQRAANDGVINMITIKQQPAPPPGKIVQLVIHYVELAKNYNKSFRFQFMPNLKDGSGITFQAGDAGGGASTSITGVIDSLLPKLNWAKQHGYGRILESSSLIVQDGKKGVLNSFQEVPYTTAQGGQGTPVTSFKRVGMQSGITPIILGERSDSINLTIEFEISSLSGFSTAGPLTSNNQMQTDIVVRSGQSAAVGGLITNRANTDFNKLPDGVASNPIISLYASRQFQRNQSQFVVFITPIIKSSASAGSEKIKKKFRLRD
ncbi:MAG: BON domain-containing protein [Bdellovibrio sp.]|jgi:pilus assembly protein CpaC